MLCVDVCHDIVTIYTYICTHIHIDNSLYNVVARMANKYFHTCQTEIFVVMAKGKLIIICHVAKELHGAESGDTTHTQRARQKTS